MIKLRRLTSLLAITGLFATGMATANAAEPNDPNQHHRGNRPQQARPAPAPQARPAPQPSARPAPPVARAPVIAPPAGPRYEPSRRTEPRHFEARRRGEGRGYRRGAGAAAVIIGSTLAYGYYRGPNRDSIYDRCDRNFPDFDYDTGTFVNDDGDRELCPYLAPYVD